MSGRKGFTLLELLLLMAIVALVVVIFCSAFARARLKARQSGCQDNLRQLAQAIALYANNWDGCAPGVAHPLPGPKWPRNEYVSWQVAVSPYVKSREVYACPSRADWCVAGANAPDDETICFYHAPLPKDWKGVSLGYAMNPLLQLSVPIPLRSSTPVSSWFDYINMTAGKTNPSLGFGGRNYARLARPAEVMMLSEANNPTDNCESKANWPNACGFDWEPCNTGVGVNFAEASPREARHHGGNNWAFADGHVEWVPSGLYMCSEGGMGAGQEEILSNGGMTMQRIHGLDQLR